MKAVAILLMFVVLAAGCVQQQETVKIGAVLPLSGIASIHGQNERQGIDLAVNEINAVGGINGKKLEVIYEDDQTQPAKTVTSINKLKEFDNVSVIIGGSWDILANAAMGELDRQQVVLLSPSALPDTVEQRSRYFYSVYPAVGIYEKKFEQFISSFPKKRAGIIVVNYPWGIAHAETFKKAAAASNATIVKEIRLQNFDNNDLSTELSILKDADVDIIFATLNFNDMALLGRKRIELNVTSKILAVSNFASTIEAGRLPIELGEGVIIFHLSEPSNEFIEKFNKTYGKPPEIYSDSAYDTVYLIKYAFENYGKDSESVLQAIMTVNFTGVSGQIYFGDKYYPENKQPVLTIIRNGAFVRYP